MGCPAPPPVPAPSAPSLLLSRELAWPSAKQAPLTSGVRTGATVNAQARLPICGRTFEAAFSVPLPVVLLPVVVVVVGYSPRNLRLLVGDSPMASSSPRVSPCVRLIPT